ncbi:membrane protein [Candidatus Omnitrophus magneticus]|uniref:Membrane protein n=1 Tax=Candidatus Omnitrophus magneticus TaxID=1609969 RepID=A0A0F0CPU9_9BACT|nr:membrane protein [Candidatus Omnitrophus magneticus]
MKFIMLYFSKKAKKDWYIMLPKKFIFFLIGIIELFIGITALMGCFIVQTWHVGIPIKPWNVYIFVVITAIFSIILGIGILKRRLWANELLIFFSGYVVINKILMYSGLLTFNSHIVKIIPIWAKDSISFLYHIVLVIILLYFKLIQPINLKK